MKQSDAKTKILQLWSIQKRHWTPGDHNAFYHSASEFYDKLESDYPELLSFRSADKWQTIKGWINQHEKYPNC